MMLWILVIFMVLIVLFGSELNQVAEIPFQVPPEASAPENPFSSCFNLPLKGTETGRMFIGFERD